MNSEKPLELSEENAHALFAPSQPSWLRYETEEQVIARIKSYYAQAIGTLTHDLAKKCIERRKKLNKNSSVILELHLLDNKIPEAVIDIHDLYPNFMTYVNDCISMKMLPEQKLVYSSYCFGTADALSFRKNLLRINDLKTGKLVAKMDQLKDYAALFCLKNDINPASIKIELRIYQAGEVNLYIPQPNEIQDFMDRNVVNTNIIDNFLRRTGSYDE